MNCRNCGQPTTSKYGVCDSTPECHALNKQASYEANRSATPAFCLCCGKQLGDYSARFTCRKNPCRALGVRLDRMLKRLEANNG
ncbi:MAG TPA: hypothetical protein VMB21_15355 [Candidatus Limnocylindria bacterium]|nr:hypothetical protein [Candidatus Limnocylindria bacterium]